MIFKNKSLLYAGFITGLLGFNVAYASEVEEDQGGLVLEEEKKDHDSDVDGGLTLPVRAFPKIGPIHRGFSKKDDGTYTFTVMGQGKIHKNGIFSCFSSADPGSYGIAQLTQLKEDEESAGNWLEDDTFEAVVTSPFNMPANDLRVGRQVFENLIADSTYQLKIGYVRGNFDHHSDETPPDFANAHVMTIKTPPQAPGTTASILYGSCARIGKAGPITIWQDEVDTILRSMHQNIQDSENTGVTTDAVLTLGDFPYMDALGEFFAAKDLDEMHRRVQLLYGTGGARLLMKRAPFIQVRDDHEWWNDSTSEIPPNRQNRADAAKKIYDLFQRPMGEETENFYQVVEGNFEAFVCDTRSEREPSLETPKFMSEGQMAALKAWLSEPSRADRIKPVFFSAPVFMLQTQDTFWNYKQQLGEFLNWIKVQDIKYLFFGSGDIHVGKTGLFKFEGGPFVLEDASSALHKINHNKDALLTDQFDMTDDGGPKLSATGGLSPTVTEDHFTRVDLNHHNHTVRIKKFDRDNTVLMDVMYNLEEGNRVNIGENQKYMVTPVTPLVDDDEDEIG